MRSCACLDVLPAPGDVEVNQLEEALRSLSLSNRELKWHGCGPLMEDGLPIAVSFRHEESEDARVAAHEIEDLIQKSLPSVESIETSLTAPSIFPILPYFCQQVNIIVSADDAAAEVLLKQAGIVLMENCIVGPALEALSKLAKSRIAWCDRGLDERGLSLTDEKDFRFREVARRGYQRGDLLFEDPAPAEVTSAARHSPWMPVVTRLLGEPADDLACDVSIIYSRPGSGEQEWHADGPHLGAGWCAGWEDEDEASPAYAACVFMPLVDLNLERGFTQFWPGTHKYSSLLGFGGAAPLLGATVDAIVKKGSAVIYDYRLMHRGMPNTSHDERPILQFVYHHRSYVETRNYGTEDLFDGK